MKNLLRFLKTPESRLQCHHFTIAKLWSGYDASCRNLRARAAHTLKVAGGRFLVQNKEVAVYECLTAEVKVIKHFFRLMLNKLQRVSMEFFQTSLIFQGKAWNLLVECGTLGCSIGACPGITYLN